VSFFAIVIACMTVGGFIATVIAFLFGEGETSAWIGLIGTIVLGLAMAAVAVVVIAKLLTMMGV
jgi:hypothetical protein